MKKLLIGLILGVSILTAIFFWWDVAVVKRNYDQILEIDKNYPLKKSLENLGTSEKISFKLYLKFKNGGRNIKAGYYELLGNYSIKEIVDLLEEGRYKKMKFTIPEGYSYKEILDSLESKGAVKREKFEEELSQTSFFYPTPGGNFEGYFYPETYFIPEGASEKKIISIILNEFMKRFPAEKYPDKEKFYEMLILASVIEREAKVSSEKKLISSVFHNRLDIDMNLASDATVNYLYGYSKRRMYYKDLEIDSPYNTYKYKGLPPAPICSPDYNSVEAAFNPEKTDYLFFVAQGDGSHYFSKSYKEHMKFQEENRKKR